MAVCGRHALDQVADKNLEVVGTAIPRPHSHVIRAWEPGAIGLRLEVLVKRSRLIYF